MLERVTQLSVLLGIAVILGGCVVSVAQQNPGGPPLSGAEAGRARMVAYIAIAVGATLAVGVPLAVMLVQKRNGRDSEK